MIVIPTFLSVSVPVETGDSVRDRISQQPTIRVMSGFLTCDRFNPAMVSGCVLSSVNGIGDPAHHPALANPTIAKCPAAPNAGWSTHVMVLLGRTPETGIFGARRGGPLWGGPQDCVGTQSFGRGNQSATPRRISPKSADCT